MSDLVALAVYSTRSDAEIVKARLVSDGIEAIVIADDEGGLNPGFYSRYGVRVVVASADLMDARESVGVEVIGIPGEAMQMMVDHTRAWAPNEACGLIAGTDNVVEKAYRLVNADAGPDRFTLDPDEYFSAWQDASAHGWEIIGLFHSHPMAAPIPSSTDIDGGGDPSWVNVIVGVEDGRIAIRAYRYVDGVVSSVEIERR
ncbi:MAG: Mov34/MPN/PAD-1 family protein [Actinomycetota bacterium]|nr:Mov34/MPN/PAD-1 family protein [Actinomycetota bacterium]